MCVCVFVCVCVLFRIQLPYCYLFKWVPILANFREFEKIANNSMR